MNRKNFLQQLALFSAGSVLSPSLINTFTLLSTFHPIRNNIGTFTGRGGTIGWMATSEFIVAIDSQFPNSAEDFISGISEYGSGPDRILFNTHHHGDHVAGNGVFSREKFRIVAHQNVPELQRTTSEDQGNETNQTYAGITFDSEYTFDAGSEKITAKHYGPGHTGGDSVIRFNEANIVHMGDLVFNRWYPFIDREGGASIKNWIRILETVEGEADSQTIFIFGHANANYGITGDRSDVLYMRDFLSKLLEHVQNGINEGKSRKEITNVEQFSEFPNYQSAGARLSLPANLQVAYEELTD